MLQIVINYFEGFIMARYMAVGYKKYTRKEQEGFIFPTYQQAYADALGFLKSDQYAVILILRDSEGTDNIANAGKFFLERIVKWKTIYLWKTFQHVKRLLSWQWFF